MNLVRLKVNWEIFVVEYDIYIEFKNIKKSCLREVDWGRVGFLWGLSEGWEVGERG